MKIESFEELATCMRNARKEQGLTQAQLALACGVGVRFIIDLEKAKPTAQIGKVFYIVKMLGLSMHIEP
ncbi:MAG: helix-turn-helix domain-containing protein [Akkermansia sp.]